MRFVRTQKLERGTKSSTYSLIMTIEEISVKSITNSGQGVATSQTIYCYARTEKKFKLYIRIVFLRAAFRKKKKYV
jgi:hypothetical protein